MGSVYVMKIEPAEIPSTKPVVEPIVAIVVLLLVQIPPDEVSFSKSVPPTHRLVSPVIGAGAGLIVTAVVIKQPEPIV